jgi:hypothetical protein
VEPLTFIFTPLSIGNKSFVIDDDKPPLDEVTDCPLLENFGLPAIQSIVAHDI